jgi:uncharacterized protein (DUF1499 family)
MAKASPFLALTAGTLALLGLLGAHFGILAPLTGFYGFLLGALLGGSFTVLFSLLAVFLARGGRDPEGMRLSLAGLAVGLGLLLVVFAAGSPGSGLPPINDITTDLDNPPEFASASVVPEYAGRDMSYPPDFVSQVRDAYPDLKPIRLTLSPEAAYVKALATATELGWDISAQSDARFVFDAREETHLFRFVDDITVRVVAVGTGSKVDIRSKSRDGQGDVGANAARIRRFEQTLQQAIQ